MQIIKCLVDRVIAHPGSLTTEEMVAIREDVKAPTSEPKHRAILEDEEWNLNVDEGKLVNDMPRNSIVAIPVGPSQQVENIGEKIICYPFFSSHISLPIKSGEMVWVFAETDFDNEEDLGVGPFYWMSRVHGSLLSEDVSFTHYERQFEPLNLNFSEKDQDVKDVIDMMKEYGPKFPGEIFAASIRDTVFQKYDTNMEPVPRLTKLPPDLVLQGSHNTAICLGTSISDTRQMENKLEQKQALDPKVSVARDQYDTSESYGGAIDIVVGRASIISALDRLTEESDGIAYGQNGSPLMVLNDLGDYETKKNPTFLDTEKSKDILHPRNFNMQEGDPDIMTDASRIYLSINDNIDDTMNISPIMANSLYGDEIPETMGTDSGGNISQFEALDAYNAVFPLCIDEAGPAIAVKSKNVRIVAGSSDNEVRSVWIRKDDADPAEAKEVKIPGEQGSIILIKEGKLENETLLAELEIPTSAQMATGGESGPFDIEHSSEDGNGRAVIAMGADGTIYIDGPRIVIGSGNEKENGKGTQISLGLDAYEPIVMGKQLNATLQAFMEDVIKFITDTFVNHEHATGAGPSGPAGTGTDIPATQQNVQTHGTDMQTLVDSLNLHLSKIGKTK